MIDLYCWPTPNAHKVSIFLEEARTPYRVIPVNIGKGEQFTPEFLAISPNNRMPAIVDPDGPDGKPFSLFESGAILMYLGDKTGQFFASSKATRERYVTIEWLMWQMSGVGPMFGQWGHFANYAKEKIPYAIERYTSEAKRLLGVLDRRLAEVAFVAGDYSIADMAIFPWVRGVVSRLDMAEYPHVNAWIQTLEDRPAVKRGLGLLEEHRRQGPMSDEERDVLFGKKQFGART
jgi:GST-like protein